MTWPAVFDGKGALFVRCDNDPDVQAARIPGLTWCAVKVNGADASPLDERRAWATRMRARGVKVGSWGWCAGPPLNDTRSCFEPPDAPFVIYDVESPYKQDEGGHYEWAAQLVAAHKSLHGDAVPAAVTSYGGYVSSIDFASFAAAGWPVFAQVYDAFKPGDEISYSAFGPYPHEKEGPNLYPVGVHRLTRSLSLSEGEAVYRPESIDG